MLWTEEEVILTLLPSASPPELPALRASCLFSLWTSSDTGTYGLASFF